MRTIKYTNAFKRDYIREKSGKSRQYAAKLDREVMEVIALLAADAALPRSYVDHPLTGDWKDFRDCHVRPDLVLIYRKPDAATLELVRLGSHSEIGL
jgi:mRNA interferase YafQ